MRDVAFSCDDNGVRFLKVAVWSLLAHYRGDEPIRVNVFDGFGGHSAAHRAEMRELVAHFPKATLRYVNAEPAVEPYRDLILNREKSRWNVFTWTPIFTPQLLPDATGKVIHFDIDMLFNADVSELFELDLGDHLIACTYEYDKYGNNAGKVVWEKGILPPTVERYFNTGVLVFNAEACRAERTWEKIVAWYKAHYDIADRIEQDAWNALYHDRMLPLHVKWNFHDRAIKNYAKWNPSERYWLGNPPKDCYEAALKPSLLHFWGPKKPWKVSHRPYRRLYHAAMRAVGLKSPREPLLAPVYDAITAFNLWRMRVHFRSPVERHWRRHYRRKAIKHAFEAPFVWLGIGCGFLLFRVVTHRGMLRICDMLSVVFYHFDRRGRRRALETLRIVRGLCTGDEGTPSFDPDRSAFDPTRRESVILRRSYRNMARTIGHVFWTCAGDVGRIPRAGELSQATKRFLRENRPAVTVSAHIGCWEILSQLAHLEGHRMISVAKRIGSGRVTEMLMRSRRSMGQEIVEAKGAMKHLMKGIAEGKSLGLLVDQSVDPCDGGLWVRFLGRPMSVSAAPAFFAAKAKAPIIVAWSRPLRGGRYRCEVLDTIPATEVRDIWKTTQRCTTDIERVVRRHPSCWVMNYNFFSNVPSDADLEKLAEREGV